MLVGTANDSFKENELLIMQFVFIDKCSMIIFTEVGIWQRNGNNINI